MNVGIEIGGTKLQVVTAPPGLAPPGLTRPGGTIEQRFRYVVEPARGAAGVLAQIEDALAQIGEPITAVGVGFGGPVDGQTGRVAQSHQVSGWAGFDLAGWLRERTGASVVRIENDANVAALGEARQGVATGFSRVFYVTLGSGVGGGMVVDGQLYHGASPGEAEIGHLWLVPPGENQPGQTIEQTVSGWAVDRQIRDLLPQLPADSVLKRLITEAAADGTADKQAVRGSAKYLHPAYEAGDPVARMLIEQIGSVLALGLSHVVHLFHPDALVLGGGLSLIGEPLRASVRQALPRFVMPAFHPPPVVLLAKLGEDAVPVGALTLVMNDEPDLLPNLP